MQEASSVELQTIMSQKQTGKFNKPVFEQFLYGEQTRNPAWITVMCSYMMKMMETVNRNRKNMTHVFLLSKKNQPKTERLLIYFQ